MDELTKIRDLIDKYFNLEELIQLCFDLGIDYENLSGSHKRTRAQSLVSQCNRRGMLSLLLKRCQHLRPHIDWPSAEHISSSQVNELDRAPIPERQEGKPTFSKEGMVNPTNPYFVKQFEIYQDIWAYLYELKIIGDALWEHVDGHNIHKFSKVLIMTAEYVDKMSVFIEAEDYSKLDSIIGTFWSYGIGKQALHAMCRENEEHISRIYELVQDDEKLRLISRVGFGDGVEPKFRVYDLLIVESLRVIKKQIESNHGHKEQYDEIILKIRNSFRERLKHAASLI